MKDNTMYSWDEENKVATVILKDKDNVFIGIAQCHPDDLDMCNEKTGTEIAYQRVLIKYYTHLRDNEIKPALKALLQLQNEMKYSKKHDENSYEARSLRKAIYRKKVDLDTIKDLLDESKVRLKTYLSDKDAFYKKIRANREKDKVGQKS